MPGILIRPRCSDRIHACLLFMVTLSQGIMLKIIRDWCYWYFFMFSNHADSKGLNINIARHALRTVVSKPNPQKIKYNFSLTICVYELNISKCTWSDIAATNQMISRKCRTNLNHSGRVTHTRVNKLIIIVSDNGLSPGRRQAIIWTNAAMLLIGPLGTNFN